MHPGGLTCQKDVCLGGRKDSVEGRRSEVCMWTYTMALATSRCLYTGPVTERLRLLGGIFAVDNQGTIPRRISLIVIRACAFPKLPLYQV